MSERLLTQQSFASLVQEIQDAIQKLDGLYPKVLEAIRELNTCFDLTQNISLQDEKSQKLWKDFEKQLQFYCSHLERLVSAYQDLSIDLQTLLSSSGEEGVQGLSREGEVLAESIRLRQEAGRLFLQLYEILKKVSSQGRASYFQQGQIKDVLFGLEMLRGV